MKQIYYLLFFIFSFVSCQKQSESNKNNIDISLLTSETLGYPEKYQLYQKLSFEEITKEEYEKSKYIENQLFNHFGKKNANENFELETKNHIIQLNSVKKIGGNNIKFWYEYLEFYPSLNMYAFASNSESEGINYSDFELLNKENSKLYKIISIGDGRIENPIISTQTSYLAYYYNQEYEENMSFIGIIKTHKNGVLKEYKSYNSDSFKINQIKWKNDNVLLIKASSDNGVTFKYYKSNVLDNI